MKNVLKFILVMLCWVTSMAVGAYGFSSEYNGVTIYYRIFSYFESETAIYDAAEVTYFSFDSNGGIYSGYENVESISIPDFVYHNNIRYYVRSIGDWAFYSCSGLTSIEIPNSVTSIGSSAFEGCSGLTSIEIPNSVTSIGNYAFHGCSGLTNVEIPNSVTSIGNYAFDGCSGLTSIEIPNSVTSIGNSAFGGCSGLTSIEIPNSVTSIGDWAFYNCSGLTSIEIPNSVTNIGNYAFGVCSGLKSIEIPNSVTSIGDHAFYYCSGLTSVEIPNSVTSIGNYAFQGCSGLTEIHWTPNAETDYSSMIGSSGAYLPSTSRTLYLHKNADNAAMVETAKTNLSGKFKEIIVVEDYGSYDLTVTSAGMSTLYLDFPVVVPDDDNLLGVFYVFQIDGNIMLLKRLRDYIPANNGVIVMANAGTFTFNGTGDEVAEITDNQLQGVTESTPVSSIDGTVYTLGRGVNSGYFGFHKYTGANIPANKVFLVRNASSGVNSFNLVLDNEDGTSTAIGRIEDGEFIPENNVVYDLQGRRVENPSKGIYIVNGKKQYIK